MPDYGHPLRFGSFITPRNRPVSRPADLALLSEEHGLDLVTFQDHPYQPQFHDTWTLLAWVAARTERIALAGNVLNLPLRQPAVLARAAASLDLLTGGRVRLGIGAGGFWDAIAAMGGKRLTPAESVDALREAIEVMRGIWNTDDTGLLRAGGMHHRVDGAKRGPAPAHPIPIWVGAYKKRMLELTGTVADGWLPSMPYLKPGDITRGNAIIDAAAKAAGRDPREIERLLNITPQESVEDIVSLALDEGISTFILAGDDPRLLERFGRDVAPAVREAVERGRARRGTATVRPARVKARSSRVPGIDYAGIPDSLADRALEPGDPGYARYTAGYLRGGAPALVLRPRTVAEVQDAVRFAARNRDVPLGIFSAGHGISGRSLNNGGIVIDVGALNAVEVLDAESGRVRIGPGARWLDVARELTPHGLAITSGDHGGVGVGGLATAGGVGLLARSHGLTIDHLRSVDVVLADGTLAHASAEENPDLFWAVRGAGANFGVAVSFEFEAAHVGKVGFAQLVFDATDTAGFVQRWGATLEAADRRVTGEIILGPGQGGRRFAQAILVVESDDPDTIVELLQPFADIAPLMQQSVVLTTYDEVIGFAVTDDEQHGFGEPHSRSGMVEHLTPEFAKGVAEILDARASYFFAIRALGGKVADVPADATAWGWRRANFTIGAFGTRNSGLDERWDTLLLPHMEGLYLSFETSRGPEVVARAFPPAHLARLRELKHRYDPTGLFRDNFFIDPAERGADTGVAAGVPA
ncbi:LLM class flavin-dependent oxidoreductase [Pseudonocardia thermophila]|uniref:LLM class flavin-dependent oxidoreductase n=1 Tax=Pseudonocardia thermophila TaxID=1848 RepID=UPI003CD0D96F